jgi:leader peptidase (prepilin peptidase) / N-methyltransferase
LALLMLAIAVSDARRFIIPDQFTAAAFALALLAALVDAEPFRATAVSRLMRAAATAVPFLILMVGYERLRGRPGLGLGDVKLAGVAGAWLDWYAVVAVIEVAALAGLAVYGVRSYIYRRPVDMTTQLPFGLFLAPAIWFGWLAETAFVSQ